jgi:ketosteroid isomerase-like protein
MSDENVALVRAVFDDLNRGDHDAAFSRFAADAEFDNTRANGPNSRVLRGRDAISKAWAEFAEMWESLALEMEPRDAGDQVAVPVILRVNGRDGIEVVARPAFVGTVRHGEITALCFYQEHHEALEAAGLSE